MRRRVVSGALMAVALLGTPASNTPGVVGHDTSTAYSLFTYTTSAGSDRLLVVFFGGGGTGLVNPTAMTYGGQAGTHLAGYLKTDGTFVLVDLFYWLEAGIAAAANTTVSITTWSGAVLMDLCVGAAAFSGVHQTVPFGTPVTASGTGTTPSTGSVTVGTDELSIGSVSTDDDNAFIIKVGSIGTVLFADIEGLNGDTGLGAQYAATTGALEWTTDSQGWAAAGVAVKPAAAAANTTLDWKSPAVQLQNHAHTSIINMLAMTPMPVPYLVTTATRVTNPLDWVALQPEVMWTDG